MNLSDATPATLHSLAQGDTVYVYDSKLNRLRGAMVTRVTARSVKVQLAPFVNQTFKWSAPAGKFIIKDRYSVLELMVPKA